MSEEGRKVIGNLLARPCLVIEMKRRKEGKKEKKKDRLQMSLYLRLVIEIRCGGCTYCGVGCGEALI